MQTEISNFKVLSFFCKGRTLTTGVNHKGIPFQSIVPYTLFTAQEPDPNFQVRAKLSLL